MKNEKTLAREGVCAKCGGCGCAHCKPTNVCLRCEGTGCEYCLVTDKSEIEAEEQAAQQDLERRERRARRLAQMAGLALHKSRYRIPELHAAYPGYMLIDLNTHVIVEGAYPDAFASSLEEIEEYIAEAQ
jgi:hypothetical protein